MGGPDVEDEDDSTEAGTGLSLSSAVSILSLSLLLSSVGVEVTVSGLLMVRELSSSSGAEGGSVMEAEAPDASAVESPVEVESEGVVSEVGAGDWEAGGGGGFVTEAEPRLLRRVL